MLKCQFIGTLALVLSLGFGVSSKAFADYWECKCTSGQMIVIIKSDGSSTLSCTDGGRVECVLRDSKPIGDD